MAMNKNHPEGRQMKLMYLFGSFRPSERAELSAAAEATPELFLNALGAFLAKWAEATWIEEYNVERVGEWIAAKCSTTIRNGALELARGELAKGGNEPIRVTTYRALIAGMNQYSAPALHSVHAQERPSPAR
ncbi:hypothetical protein LCM4576_29685 [Mesorhizobium sp. LCM 4576]|uniref:hypothetical protein n=1 Tax=Mesorhizobium sp. LCM 4576 TaxID=1848289 RepID=UPI0008DB22A7|nr:hypothetical protein [Mesorhizobium sp. LCM 4576]OHV63596.1 hypothetical protein LCM4576_29685 [Mesorhizobium sp. LCM 4576]